MGRTVLVADDSPSITNRASGILKGEGLEIVTVSNGVAAIKKLPNVKPLLVLADVNMPGRDGYEVCDFVKKTPDLSHVPVLLIFSDPEPYDEQRGAQVRADGRIRKPFNQEELVSIVSKFLAAAESAKPAPARPQASPTTISMPATVPMPTEEELSAGEEERGIDPSAFAGNIAFGVPPVEETPLSPPALEPPGAELPPGSPTFSPLTESSAAAQPAFVEESSAAIPEPEPEPAPEPTVEKTMMFRLPADIASPVLRDELAPSAEPAEPPPPPPEPEQAPVAASTLESFSLGDATAGHVRFSGAGEEVAPVAEAPPPAPEPVPAEAPAVPSPAVTIDPGWVYAVVRKAVIKLSPAMLPMETVEEMARRLTDEIINELNAESSQVQ